MSYLSLTEQMRGVSLLAVIDRILMLDDLWTHHVENGRPGKADLDSLDTITAEIINLLEIASREASWVSQVVSRDEEKTNQSLTLFAANTRISADARQNLSSKLLEKPGLVEFIRQASEKLPERVELERNDLQKKISKLREGQGVPGDISKNTKCFLQGLCCGVTAGVALVSGSVSEGIFAGYQAVELGDCF
jgi:hypothetical protein